jgi:hypothetical protein
MLGDLDGIAAAERERRRLVLPKELIMLSRRPRRPSRRGNWTRRSLTT